MGSSPLNLLLDTHIWLWSLTEPERTTEAVVMALSDQSRRIWLSPSSIWEFLLLAECGRVSIHRGLTRTVWVEAALAAAPMNDAPLSRQVALRSRSVRVEHEGPADRFLTATASVYELTLVAADERLLRGEGFQTLANR